MTTAELAGIEPEEPEQHQRVRWDAAEVVAVAALLAIGALMVAHLVAGLVAAHQIGEAQSQLAVSPTVPVHVRLAAALSVWTGVGQVPVAAAALGGTAVLWWHTTTWSTAVDVWFADDDDLDERGDDDGSGVGVEAFDEHTSSGAEGVPSTADDAMWERARHGAGTPGEDPRQAANGGGGPVSDAAVPVLPSLQLPVEDEVAAEPVDTSDLDVAYAHLLRVQRLAVASIVVLVLTALAAVAGVLGYAVEGIPTPEVDITILIGEAAGVFVLAGAGLWIIRLVLREVRGRLLDTVT